MIQLTGLTGFFLHRTHEFIDDGRMTAENASCVGTSPLDGAQRYTFGLYQLTRGLTLVGVMMGMFAMSQVMIAHGQGSKSMPKVSFKNLSGKDAIFSAFKDAVNHKVNVIRSFIMGLRIGFLPDMGSGLSCMVAYSQAKSSAKPSDIPKTTAEETGTRYFIMEAAKMEGLDGYQVMKLALDNYNQLV